MQQFRVLSLIFVLSCITENNVETLEPITTSVAVGTAVVASAFFAGYDKVKCSFYECCDNYWFAPNMTQLRLELESRLHGQHLVIDNVLNAVKAHIRTTDPPKALVLSFHGWTGAGKNFVSKMIAEQLFRAGSQSKFVHLFIASHHFPHERHLETYKDQLRDWIRGNVSECGRSLFIFDEMDKMPGGLMDTIKPYIDHYPEINGVNYRKSIFLFLSNTAGSAITNRALKHWQDGKKREEIKYKDMEEIIINHSFNEEGGLWHSSLIAKNLISAFIPFLPMERVHVKLCIRDDLKNKRLPIWEELLSEVAEELQYFPEDEKLYSKSGCKRVSEKVDQIVEQYRSD